MLVSDFDFDLPEELIAQHPPARRGSSRMLVLDRRTGGLRDEMFQSLPRMLQPGDLLILNDSRVLPARLFATRGGLRTQADSPQPSGVIEVLLTEEMEDSEAGSGMVWRVLVKPARKVRVGETLHFFAAAQASVPKTANLEAGSLGGDGARDHVPGAKAPFHSGARVPGLKSRPISETGSSAVEPEAESRPILETPVTETGSAVLPGLKSGATLLSAEVVGAGEFGERTLRFGAVADFYERVGRIGHMPLPPYIRREQAGQTDSAEDRERYQTVYSARPGSAAAPTAGLHFTPEILAELEARGVEIRYITLHVGLGTFQPVRVERLEEIRLHAERYTLPAATAEALNRALAEGRRIVAVGTTTTRTLEHIAAQVQAGEQGEIAAHSGSTSIFLSPGHRFLIVGGLLTNFHLPESTLLMLVSAFAAREGEEDRGRQVVLGAYAHAIRERYRFYSYGDCMLLL